MAQQLVRELQRSPNWFIAPMLDRSKLPVIPASEKPNVLFHPLWALHSTCINLYQTHITFLKILQINLSNLKQEKKDMSWHTPISTKVTPTIFREKEKPRMFQLVKNI